MTEANLNLYPAMALAQKADERNTAGRLALEVMHEIRNSLEALGHLTYLARQEAGSTDHVRKYMDLAEEQISILNKIASQTLGFARLSQAPKPVDFIDLAESALRIYQWTIESQEDSLGERRSF